MSDGTDGGAGSGDSPGGWRDHERVDEQYREPEEPGADLGPDVPEVPDPSENDVDPELHRRFWALVIVFNVAILALSLGAMFAVFEGDYALGGQLLLAGTAAFAFGLYRYRTTKRRLGDRSGGEATADGGSESRQSDDDGGSVEGETGSVEGETGSVEGETGSVGGGTTEQNR